MLPQSHSVNDSICYNVIRLLQQKKNTAAASPCERTLSWSLRQRCFLTTNSAKLKSNIIKVSFNVNQMDFTVQGERYYPWSHEDIFPNKTYMASWHHRILAIITTRKFCKGYVSVILCTGGWLPSTPHMSHDQRVCLQGDLPPGGSARGDLPLGGGVCLKGGRRRGMGCWTDLQALWDTVNKWVVRILLECILVYDLFLNPPNTHSLSFLVFLEFCKCSILECNSHRKIGHLCTPWVKFRKYFEMRQGQKIHFKVLTLKSMTNFFFSWVLVLGA